MYYLEYIIPAVFITGMVYVIYKNFKKERNTSQNSGLEVHGDKNPPTRKK